MRVDLERLRRSLARYAHAEENAVPVPVGELEALLAVVDAARNGVLAWSEGAYADIDCGSLEAALEPFTPPAGRAREEVDRWNAKQRAAWGYLARVRAEVDADANPRDRARDQLADAGVTVQRQFRSDQERIAELERERDEWRGMWRDEIKRALDAVEERDEARKERDEWKGRHKAVTNGLSNHVARADRAEERIAELERQLEAERTRGIDHGVYEMVCEERDTLEARLAKVRALVDAALYATTGPGWTGALGQEPETTISMDAYRRLYDAACAVRGEKP